LLFDDDITFPKELDSGPDMIERLDESQGWLLSK